jgi:hypothetical protein
MSIKNLADIQHHTFFFTFNNYKRSETKQLSIRKRNKMLKKNMFTAPQEFFSITYRQKYLTLQVQIQGNGDEEYY